MGSELGTHRQAGGQRKILMPVRLPDELAEGVAHLDSETEPELFQFLKTIAQVRRQTRLHSSAKACLETHVFNGHNVLGSPAEETVRTVSSAGDPSTL